MDQLFNLKDLMEQQLQFIKSDVAKANEELLAKICSSIKLAVQRLVSPRSKLEVLYCQDSQTVQISRLDPSYPDEVCYKIPLKFNSLSPDCQRDEFVEKFSKLLGELGFAVNSISSNKPNQRIVRGLVKF